MATVAIEKCEDVSSKPRALFEELDKRLDEVRRRAYGLFERRGGENGSEVEDWLEAEREVMGRSATQVREADGNFELEMALPDYDPSDVQITATPEEVVVHAQTRKERTRGIWAEYRSDEVFRRFPLREPIDPSLTNATLERGILRIRATKASNGGDQPARGQAA